MSSKQLNRLLVGLRLKPGVLKEIDQRFKEVSGQEGLSDLEKLHYVLLGDECLISMITEVFQPLPRPSRIMHRR